ncbi:MAG: hypothetical protein O3B86_04090 [Planctomycetota bacterium]|nr:hypothetical protein [Planctomycetota bacterium]
MTQSTDLAGHHTERGVQIVPFDITLDGNHYDRLFDFPIRADAIGQQR